MEQSLIIEYITLTVVIEKEDDHYVSYCQELGTPSCGDTVEEAFENATDAIIVHLTELEETGERKRFFKQCGIEIKTRALAKQPPSMNVPFDAFVRRYKAPLVAHANP